MAPIIPLYMHCPLCHSHGDSITPLLPTHFHCRVCDYRFLDPTLRLAPDKEKIRYLTHNNDISDEGYRNFIRPIVDSIRRRYPTTAKGLDFGAGTSAIAAHLLEEVGYTVARYDTFFWPDASVLQSHYDFIVASEVVEHLFNPRVELSRLRSRLKPTGVLAVMTLLYDPQTNFADWYYKNDPTHVGLFSEKSFDWIKKDFQFAKLEIETTRLVLLFP